jgi:hypothetical protein
VDFIFGKQGRAYFENNLIGVSSAGFVTASGRSSNDDASCKLAFLPPGNVTSILSDHLVDTVVFKK